MYSQSINFVAAGVYKVSTRTEIPSQFIDGHRSPMGPIDGHQWSIDGHRWDFSNVDPIDGSSMDHRWPIDGNRNFRSQKFVRLGRVQNFNKTLAIWVFHSVYLNFVWDFEGAQTFYSEMKLYIVIHIIYLCEKPDSVDFPREKPQIFWYKDVFSESIFCIFQICFLLTRDDFLSNGSLIPSHFHAYNCSFAMFSCFSREKLPNFLIQKRIFSQISASFRYVFFLQADGFLSNGSLIPSHFLAYNRDFARFFDFPDKTSKFFDTKTFFQSQVSASFRPFFLKADGFLSNGSSIPSHFHRYDCNFARFSWFSRENFQIFWCKNVF